MMHLSWIRRASSYCCLQNFTMIGRDFSSSTSQPSRIKRLHAFDICKGESFLQQIHTRGMCDYPSLRSQKNKRKGNTVADQSEDENVPSHIFPDSRAFVNLPKEGKFGELVYLGKHTVAYEKYCAMYAMFAVGFVVCSQAGLQFLSVPLATQMIILVPCTALVGLYLWRKSVHWKKYVLFMYYDRHDKMFTAVTFKKPLTSVFQIVLHRFHLDDVSSPSASDHNIKFKGRERIIESDPMCFRTKEIYDLLRSKQMLQ